MKVYIWGTGRVAKEYLEMGEIEQGDILGFIETKKSKDTFYNKKVYSPIEVASNDNYDYILVCVYYYGREIYNICQEVHIDVSKLVLVDNWEWSDGSPLKKIPKCCKEICDCHISNIETVFPKLYKRYIKECDIRAQRYMITTRNGYDLQELTSPMLSDEFSGKEYQTDYFRYRTFELMANEIIKKKVHGNVAELGVFKGTFSKLINKKFYDRKLYLFDTFESFDIEEYKCELESERCPEEFLDNFKDTNVDTVLEIMPHPEMCIIKKGLFPNTAVGMEDEKFAFVSIDVDFEKSILEGLRFFYPRLEQGGCIFVHDYNNRFLEGVKIAVDTYENEIGKPLLRVPLADEGGTLVVVK